MGDKNYKLTVLANPPVKRFWAVTAYDPTSRSLLNVDGSVDIYFGTEAPKDPKLYISYVVILNNVTYNF